MGFEAKLLWYQKELGRNLDPLPSTVSLIGHINERLLKRGLGEIRVTGRLVGVRRTIFSHMKKREKFNPVSPSIRTREASVKVVRQNSFLRGVCRPGKLGSVLLHGSVQVVPIHSSGDPHTVPIICVSERLEEALVVGEVGQLLAFSHGLHQANPTSGESVLSVLRTFADVENTASNCGTLVPPIEDYGVNPTERRVVGPS